jgi:hypothetical protein
MKYKEFTTENKLFNKSLHCDYCAIKLECESDYCSNVCKEKDSVWYKVDDL